MQPEWEVSRGLLLGSLVRVDSHEEVMLRSRPVPLCLQLSLHTLLEGRVVDPDDLGGVVAPERVPDSARSVQASRGHGRGSAGEHGRVSGEYGEGRNAEGKSDCLGCQAVWDVRASPVALKDESR
jgi:hypothetical protein